jgi:hypothetical protein
MCAEACVCLAQVGPVEVHAHAHPCLDGCSMCREVEGICSLQDTCKGLLMHCLSEGYVITRSCNAMLRAHYAVCAVGVSAGALLGHQGCLRLPMTS